jgi:hypothetical protein
MDIAWATWNYCCTDHVSLPSVHVAMNFEVGMSICGTLHAHGNDHGHITDLTLVNTMHT